MNTSIARASPFSNGSTANGRIPATPSKAVRPCARRFRRGVSCPRPRRRREAGLRRRAVTLASETLGIIAKMDSSRRGRQRHAGRYQKGKRPHVAEGAYDPERVQVCAQALILEDAAAA